MTMVEAARSWIGTPYSLSARVKGAGVDCATLIAECLIEAGFATREDLGVYAADWFQHAADERYMLRLLRHARRTLDTVAYRSTVAQPGDVVLTKAAKSQFFNHGGVVTAWPRIVHAIDPAAAEIDASRHPMWAFQQIAIFRPGAQ